MTSTQKDETKSGVGTDEGETIEKVGLKINYLLQNWNSKCKRWLNIKLIDFSLDTSWYYAITIFVDT